MEFIRANEIETELDNDHREDLTPRGARRVLII